MEPQAVMVYAFLVVTLLSLPPTHAEVTSEPVGGNVTQANTTKEGQEMQCTDKTTPEQRRHDLLDTWLRNEVDTRLNERESRLNTLDTRLTERDARLNDLSRQQIELNAGLNRMGSRLDGVETAITDMKEYLQNQMKAMGQKVEWALTGINPHGQKEQLFYLLQPRPRPRDFRPPRIPRVHQGCQEALTNGWTTSGVYTISPNHDKTIDVYCDQRLSSGGWMVIQARKDGSVDFYRTWNEYKLGFGELSNEFWLGNDNIHELSKHKDQELKIELTSPEGEVKYADYSSFWIDDEAHSYTLHVSGYSGGSPPGDSLRQHNNSGFSTKDRVDKFNCATRYTGAWWFENECHYSNLNGLYGSTEHAKGMNWWTWRRYSVSMKATRMLMRKKS